MADGQTTTGAADERDPSTVLQRHVYTFEVLTTKDERLTGDESMEDLHEITMNGNASGMLLTHEVEEVDADRMAELLVAQGSDPGFLLGDLDDEGEGV